MQLKPNYSLSFVGVCSNHPKRLKYNISSSKVYFIIVQFLNEHRRERCIKYSVQTVKKVIVVCQ